jgi:hypothetical protein
VPELPDPEQVCDETPLWKALEAAAKFGDRDTPRRLLVITDGENSPIDGADTELCCAACNALCKAGIIVDVVLLPNSDQEDGDPEDRDAQRALCPVCRWTGGFLLSANKLKKEEILNILKSEAFCDLSVKRAVARIEDEIQGFNVAEARETEGFVLRGSVNALPPYRQKQKAFPVGALPTPVDFRTERIVEGVTKCMEFMTVLRIKENSIDAFRVLLPSRLSYDCETAVYWDLMVQFPKDYPFVPPRLRFLAVPNVWGQYVSPFGRVNLSELLVQGSRRIYHPQMNLCEVLVSLKRFMDAQAHWTEAGGWTLNDLKATWDGKSRPLLRVGDLVPIIGKEWRAGTDKGPKELPNAGTRLYSQITWEAVSHKSSVFDQPLKLRLPTAA